MGEPEEMTSRARGRQDAHGEARRVCTAQHSTAQHTGGQQTTTRIRVESRS